MPLSDFSTANIGEVVHNLTIDEAILLTAGMGTWETSSIDRLGIPAIKVFGCYSVLLVCRSSLVSSSSVMDQTVFEEIVSL